MTESVFDTRLAEVIKPLPTFDPHRLLILVEKLTTLDSDVLVELWSVATEVRFQLLLETHVQI